MLEANGRAYTMLDTVPALAKHWCERSSDGKLLRKAYVAAEVVRHGGIAICVTVSARAEARERARQLVGARNFVEVYVDTPAAEAAQRKAARGRRTPPLKMAKRWLRRLSRSRAGVDFEVPQSADLVLDGLRQSPESGAHQLWQLLEQRGFLSPREPAR
jgi:sulfate adenylyltransferase